ncbi:hypothetical protein SAMN05192533_1294 [Mesobacillus persicus]|uniref:Uncharacterized protein n=1 Tax=Mesobacillus persicus TaxID=930146 RepID=A0A1H8KMM9_9BACI|nr:hypothetical protein [Mesobacillus persicus]SEN94067.1 hypothetical protein SAMN05192533_1294 [Mesobacillus persicus]
MREETEYITKEQLIRHSFRRLTKENEYEIVEKIGKHTVYAESFIQSSFLLSKSGDHRIFFRIDGFPKYFAGLYSLYAIIRAAKEVAEREEDYKVLETIDETDYQEIVIEYLHENHLPSGLELIRTIEEGRLKLAKRLKDDLYKEAKHYNLIESMDLFL